MSKDLEKVMYSPVDKFSFYIAGFLFVALTGYQASLQKDQVNLTRELSRTTHSQQVYISSISVKLKTVIKNQEILYSTVGDVERKIIHMCAKNGDCD